MGSNALVGLSCYQTHWLHHDLSVFVESYRYYYQKYKLHKPGSDTQLRNLPRALQCGCAIAEHCGLLILKQRFQLAGSAPAPPPPRSEQTQGVNIAALGATPRTTRHGIGCQIQEANSSTFKVQTLYLTVVQNIVICHCIAE